MLNDQTCGADHMAAANVARPGLDETAFAPRAVFDVVCYGPDGEKKWEDRAHNALTNEGRKFVLDTVFKGSSYTAAWYVLLKGAGSTAAGDTLASHAGWSELTPYSGNRPAITFGTTTTANPAVNAATAVNFTINATATVAGAGLASVNTGSSGTLYNSGDFTASRGVASGDTLSVTITLSMA